ncbi:MAG TPA: hypothetical protein VG435_14945 [Acidimicrobiales bacterium]|jgi:hypothetical protein|nr:hypothetical protein [Acidimicrobiales bacterium]
MLTATEHHGIDHRRPAGLDFAAAVFLLGTVVLHVVAMFPTYTHSLGSLVSQTDQATGYAVLAAGWALALIVGLTGPHRTPIAAALAVGLALTELGFRGTDLGQAFHDGTGTVSSGLWLMELAWVAGAVGAVLAVLAARSRHAPTGAPGGPVLATTGEAGPLDQESPFGPAPLGGSPPEESPAEGRLGEASVEESSDGEGSPVGESSIGESSVGEGSPVGESMVGESSVETEPSPTRAIAVAGPHDATAAVPAASDTSVLQMVVDQPHPTQMIPGWPEADHEDAHERWAWTILVLALAAVVAGMFLPPWDHETFVFQSGGRVISQNEGNAFRQPWEMIVGTVTVSVVILALSAVAVRLRNKAVGAAAVVGALIVMSSQLASAVALASAPTAADFGVTPAQVQQLGLSLTLKLTGWFTVEILATYALFAAVMVRATLRMAHANSPGTVPTTPERRSSSIPPGW